MNKLCFYELVLAVTINPFCISCLYAWFLLSVFCVLLVLELR